MILSGGDHLGMLSAVGGLWLATAALAWALHRRTLAFVYPLCLIGAVGALAVHGVVLFGGGVETAQLPFGLPSAGLRVRLDLLSAFFGVVVNVGIVAASLYGLGFDRRTELSGRVEPVFPVFAAAMNSCSSPTTPSRSCSHGS